MEGGRNGEERKNISFGFSLADDKIQLIDMLSEDNNDFLVASPYFNSSLQDSFQDGGREHAGFRFSGFGNSQEPEIIQPSRPSFLRRSLAWDSAFLDDAGVLDPDELSFINKGFRRKQDVCKRRPETTADGDDDSSSDWVEVEPSIQEAKSSKEVNVDNRTVVSRLRQEGLQNVPRVKKVDRSFRNKIKSDQTSTGKNVRDQNEEKMKMETTSSRRQRTTFCPKPSGTSARMKNISTRSNSGDSSGKSDVRKGSKSAETATGFGHQSSPKFSCVVSPTSAKASTVSVPLTDTCSGSTFSPQASALLRRKSESRKSKLSSSLSASKIWSRTAMRKGVEGLSVSSGLGHWNCESLSSSVGNKQGLNASHVGADKETAYVRDFPQKVGKEASDLQTPFISEKQHNSQETAGNCSSASSGKNINLRPSGLRPPSPSIRFFAENTTPRYHEATRTRKMPQKVSSEGAPLNASTQFDSLCNVLPDSSVRSSHDSACKKLKKTSSDLCKKIKRSRTDPTNSSLVAGRETSLETGRVGDHKKHPRNKYRLNSSSAEEKRRYVLKNKGIKESRGPKDNNATHVHIESVNKNKIVDDHAGDQLANLSRKFEAIDLNQDKVQELKKGEIDWHTKHNQHDVGLPAYSLFKQESQLPQPCATTDAASTSCTRAPLADKTSMYNLLH